MIVVLTFVRGLEKRSLRNIARHPVVFNRNLIKEHSPLSFVAWQVTARPKKKGYAIGARAGGDFPPF